MDVDVSVIIVSWNARELLPACLDAVVADAAASHVACEIIVVDNDSSDGSADLVRTRFPSVQVIDAGDNVGMGAGNNIGMSAARGRTMLLLNSDAEPEPGALRHMLDELDSNPRVGMVVPRLQNPDGSLQRSIRGFPSIWRIATEFWYLRKLAPTSRMFNAYYGGGKSHEVTQDIEWAMGACMLVSRAAVDDVGLMNEAYFMYDEETDWMHRLSVAGWRIRFSPDAHVMHLGGGSSSKSWGAMYRVQVCSHVRYMAARHGVTRARRARAVIVSALGFRSIIYRLAALVTGSRRSLMRERATAFSDARRDVAALDLEELSRSNIPEWNAHPATTR